MHDECVAKEICMLFVGGGALTRGKRGRATPWTQSQFDCTMGFPGEDPSQRPQVVALRNLQ